MHRNDEARKLAFREWLQTEMRYLDCWQRRGNRYLMSEFVRYAREQGADIGEVPLGRWLREDTPTLPSVESCRELAKALGKHSVEVMLAAGYLVWEDVAFIVEHYERETADGTRVPDHRGRGARQTPELRETRASMATGPTAR